MTCSPRRFQKLCAVLILIIVVAEHALSQDIPKGWSPEVMTRIKRVGGTSISPDGKWIAYTVSTPTMEGEKSEFLTQIWVVSADGKSDYQFTYGEKSCTNPSFSHDGKCLAFLSSRGPGGKNQVWMMRMTGGEAEQLTDAKAGVSSYAWSKDSKRIAYTMVDPDTEQEEKAKKEKRDMVVEDANLKYAHLYAIPVTADAQAQRKIRRLTGGNFHVTTFDWAPDGRTIVFAHQQTPSADVWPTTDIATVPSDSGAVKSLVTWKGSDSSPLYSPDGKWIAFASDKGETSWASAYDLYVVPSGVGEPKKLSETPDRNFGIVAWSGDGKGVFVTESDRTVNRVFSVPIDGAKPIPVTTGIGNFSGVSFNADRTVLAFVYQSCETPPEIHAASAKTFIPKKLTQVNADVPKLPVAKTEVIHWKSKDGKEIEGLLTYPANYEKGRKYPLILNVHGGPAGVFLQTYTAAGSIYPIQAFAQQGYAVLRPNPRGSSGYGAEFRRGNINDWGFGDYEDDQSGVDKVIAMGIAHPDSLIICGWSYGGYMTSFTVTRTKRFKAASVGAGVTDLVSFTGTSDILSFLPSYFGGEFWDRQAAYIKHSAVFNVKGVTTPTQVIHGLSDVRVPASQGYEFYHALRRQGCPTEMIAYPRTPHGPQEPKFIQDIGQRMIAWFNKHLGRNTASQ
ncbi:MAG: S9 family peptidase [Ignavibacteriales bacterium]|nr:S9 family peptidase [Ignavibacteriales bacterium]